MRERGHLDLELHRSPHHNDQRRIAESKAQVPRCLREPREGIPPIAKTTHIG